MGTAETGGQSLPGKVSVDGQSPVFMAKDGLSLWPEGPGSFSPRDLGRREEEHMASAKTDVWWTEHRVLIRRTECANSEDTDGTDDRMAGQA